MINRIKIKHSNWLYLFLFVFIFILLLYISNNIIQTDEFIQKSLSGKYNSELISDYFLSRKKWLWLQYVAIPVFLLLRTLLIAFLMQMVVFFINTKDDTSFNKFWSVTLMAEWVTVFLVTFRFFYFTVIDTDYSLEDFQSYIPGSLSNVYNISHLESWIAYPFSFLSIWELLYWLMLIFGIKKILRISFFKSFGIVLASYGVGLLIWVGFVMYLLLTNFS